MKFFCLIFVSFKEGQVGGFWEGKQNAWGAVREKQVQERVYVLLYNRKCMLSRGKRTP